MLGACWGLAKPKEEFEESESSDEEYGGRASKAATMEEKKKRKKGGMPVRWFRKQERVAGPRFGLPSQTEGAKVRYANRKDLTLTMMSNVVQIPKVTAIEIIKCHLTKIPPSIGECDFLEELKLPHNKISEFDPDLGKCPKVKLIILDFNNICEINPGTFNKSSFNKLEVLGLAHNWLTYLPADFGITSPENLIKRLDLSYNQLQSIPDSITDATKLEELNLTHNCLVSLPKEFKQFKKLEKLFLSFNQLEELPDDIGECEELRKVRIVTNKIRKLPDSMIKLWKKDESKNRGLEELLVDDNPLEMPSITAFEMDGGGIDRAFALFDQYINKKEQAASRHSEHADDQGEQADHAEGHRELPSSPTGQLAVAAAGHVDVEVRKQAPSSEFYFGLQGAQKISEIQTAQSTLLVIKRNMYIQAETEAKRLKEPFHGLVPVRDLDVYFNLLVFTMKPGFASVWTLWTKFEQGDKHHMLRAEWNEFCMCVPISLSDEIRDQMWKFLAYRGDEKIHDTDFVAAFQLHDIVDKDPWIVRITKVLRLDYYDMEVKELQNRLRSKDANTSTPQLDFNKEEADGDTAAIDNIPTQGVQVFASAQRAKAAARANTDGRALERELLKKISLDDEEYDECAAEDSSEDTASDDSANSCELSENTGSEGSEFDAQAFLNQRERLLNQGKSAAQNRRFVVDSDNSLRQLMEIPVTDFWKRAGLVKRSSEPMAKQVVRKKAQKPVQRDTNGGTIGVRRVIREVRRSMPHDDFCSLINFIIRWLTLIKFNTGATTPEMTYWHEDDPIFRHVMGSGAANPYTRKLLSQMGFARLNGTYWVWPAYHLEAGSLAPSWGDSAVPHDCPGRDPDRLDEMLSVFKCCQMQMNRWGAEFSGHVRRNKALGNII